MKAPARIAAAFALALAAAAASAAPAAYPVRLKSRTIVPEAQPFAAAAYFERDRHYLVSFEQPADKATRAALKAAGVRLLGWVPDNAVAVYVPPEADLSAVPGIAWAGSLAAPDKLSADLLALPGDEKWAVVEFFADVSDEKALHGIKAAGGAIRRNPSLRPASWLVYGSSNVFERLAQQDGVSFIFPASKALIAGQRVHACPGAMTAFGAVGNYAVNGSGWDGSGLGAVSLKYYFVNGTADIAGDQERTEVVRALNVWTQYVQVSWAAASGAGQTRSMDILWGSGAHGDAYPFDGAGSVLAHCYFPSPPNSETIAGDMHFDDDELWRVGAQYDQFTVALHESGHGLGLDHSTDPSAVMYAYYGGTVSDLQPDDIAGIRALYASTGGGGGGGDAFEPDNSFGAARAITAGSAQSHSIVPIGDVDYVRFTLAALAEVTLETSGGSDDTRLWLYSGAQAQLAYDDDSGAGLHSRISRTQAAGTALPAGTYYAKVDEYGNNAAISGYNLALTVHYLGMGDAYEPDNSAAQAQALVSGSPQARSLSPVADEDYAAFTLAVPSEIVVETSGASGDTRMWLYGVDLSEVEFNDDGGAGLFSRIDRTQAEGNVLPVGTYYVRINEASDATTIAAYTLALTVTPVGTGGDDVYEENDSQATAWSGGFNWEGYWLSRLDGLGIQRDEDWYRIDVDPARLNLDIRCTFTHASGDIDIALHDSVGTQVALSEGVEDNEQIVTRVGAGGAYFIRLYYGNAGNTYDLRWAGADPSVTQADPLLLYWPAGGTWFGWEKPALGSEADQWAQPFGWSATIPVAGDYNGNGIEDLAVYWPAGGTWYVKEDRGQGASWSRQFGWSATIPVPGDYDGNGTTDLALYWPAGGVWYVWPDGGAGTPWSRQFGWSATVPLPADYDGSGTTDFGLYWLATGMWYVWPEGGAGTSWSRQFGWSAAVPVPGDYDGNGIADLGVYAPAQGAWFVWPDGGTGVQWSRLFGWPAAAPVPGDYDGNGMTDLALWHAAGGAWHVWPDGGTVPSGSAWSRSFGWPATQPAALHYQTLLRRGLVK